VHPRRSLFFASLYRSASASFRASVSASARAAVRLVAPAHCAACDTPVSQPALFCTDCEPSSSDHARVDQLDSGLPVISTGLYEGPLGAAVRTLKYRNRPDLAQPLGLRLADAVGRAGLPDMPVLVPVPLHPLRLAERGYNQSALVARAAANALGFRSGLRVLGRVRATNEQASLDRRARLENVSAAFAVRQSVRECRIVVVDDVVTTGATALACAAALESAGAIVVAIAALARADRALLR
jgi:ComF family protein